MKALILLIFLILTSCIIEKDISYNSHHVKNKPIKHNSKFKERQIIKDNKCRYYLFNKRIR